MPKSASTAKPVKRYPAPRLLVSTHANGRSARMSEQVKRWMIDVCRRPRVRRLRKALPEGPEALSLDGVNALDQDLPAFPDEKHVSNQG